MKVAAVKKVRCSTIKTLQSYLFDNSMLLNLWLCKPIKMPLVQKLPPVVLCKKSVTKISQISQENTSIGVSF